MVSRCISWTCAYPYEFIKDTENLDKTNTLQFLNGTSPYYGGFMMNKYIEKLRQLNAKDV